MVTNLLEGLNTAQKTAVEHVEGPLLIIAGPGSGKTRVIVQRVAYLVRTCGVSPGRICVVTFTNKAAKELRDRLGRLLGGPVAGRVTAGTFHAICSRILRTDGDVIGLDKGFTIYDRDDQLGVLKKVFQQASIEPKRFSPSAILSAISGAKAELQNVEGFRASVGSYFDEVVLRAYEEYQSILYSNQAVDFDDLLMRTTLLFRDHPDILSKYQERYLHLMIDEFQDTNVAQYTLAKQLSGQWRNMAVVGDPDQSIYGWRHADIRNILNFQTDFPDAATVMLEENYRSTGNILAAASEVIGGNEKRVKKRLVSTLAQGMPVWVHEAYDEDEEAMWVVQELARLRKKGELNYGDAAVAYRVNAQSRALEEACIRHGIPYRLVGALKFYQRREIKDVIAYLRVFNNPSDDVSMERVVNVPPRGIGQKSVDELTRWARKLGVSLSKAVEILTEDPSIETTIPKAGQAALARLGIILKELHAASLVMPVTEFLDLLLDRTHYRSHLFDNIKSGEERWDNVKELRIVAADFGGIPPPAGLEAFLEQVALVSDIDNIGEGDGLTLITLHQAKGLEFSTVFMVGLEEGMLPHMRSFDDPVQMEEERRLCYVGMTRAKQRLYLTRAFRRRVNGNSLPGIPSRFLNDISRDLIASPDKEVNLKPTMGFQEFGGSKGPDESIGGSVESQRPTFKAGDKVYHAKFGEGIIVSCTAVKDDYELSVAFVNYGVKRLLHSLAKLQPVRKS
ncbi:MAG: UvrD-helicase domain-containing protein [Chloroflexota bacterium]|nr:UvrD-helicase domain-containing protein [Chloroflexota bacterium]